MSVWEADKHREMAASSSKVKNLYHVRIIIARIFWYALMFVCTLADVDTVGECCTEQVFTESELYGEVAIK